MRLALALPILALLPAAALAQVNVMIEGEVRPGVYGRVRIGETPPPVVYARPVTIIQPRVVETRVVETQVIERTQPRPVETVRPRAAAPAAPAQPAQPVYLHVPPGHAKDWKKHCRKYDACSQPVYFVRSSEYEKPKKPKKPKKDKD